MKNFTILVALFAAFSLLSCDELKTEERETTALADSSLNWADASLWYEGDTRLSEIDPTTPDVFYLLPTCIASWKDEDSTVHYNANPTKPEHLAAWRLSAELADSIFATQANFFLPYYRQAAFDALVGENAQKAIQLATQDAIESFNYYIKNLNNNRPFILAGYSQGGQMVTEILKSMDDDTYARLIAAYVVGYGITANDTVTQVGHATSHVKLAQDSTSCGVTINFNSVSSTDAICPLLCTNNIGCINPVSWTTSSDPATLLKAGSSAQPDDSHFPYGTAVVAQDPNTDVTVQIDSQYHVLIVNNIDPQRYFLPALSGFFPVGNLHLQELFFYGKYLRNNVLLRSKNLK